MNYTCKTYYNADHDTTYVEVSYKNNTVTRALPGNKLTHDSEHLTQYAKKDLIKELERLIWT